MGTSLSEYQAAVANLIQAPSSPVPFISNSQLTTYINTARNQVAADAECIRIPGSLTTAANIQAYAFNQIVVNTFTGVNSVIAVRSGQVNGQPQPLDFRNWEWFAQYYERAGTLGVPVRFAQQGQGDFGTLFFSPIPNAVFTIVFDAVCLPLAMADNTTPEAIPDLWADAVPFYAAWLALQSLQRQADANAMFERYSLLVRRGRQLATPSELPDNLPGGTGAQIAASHQTLGQPPPARGR